MAGLYQNLRGTTEDLFQVSIGGAQIKDVAGVLEVRNAADSDYAIARGATPVGDNDLVTKLYADTLEKPLIISRQADTSSSLPANTGTRGFVVVTTPGSGAVIGDVLYDDGSGTGTMSILGALEGRTIAVTDALSGGTATFEADSIYIWDEDGSAWTKIGDIGAVTGAKRLIRYILDNTASQDSASTVPAGAQVVYACLEITTAYSGGTTISIGDTSTADLFMTTAQNDPLTSGCTFCVIQDTNVPSASVVRTTVGGSPAAGAGVVTVCYANENA